MVAQTIPAMQNGHSDIVKVILEALPSGPEINISASDIVDLLTAKVLRATQVCLWPCSADI